MAEACPTPENIADDPTELSVVLDDDGVIALRGLMINVDEQGRQIGDEHGEIVSIPEGAILIGDTKLASDDTDARGKSVLVVSVPAWNRFQAKCASGEFDFPEEETVMPEPPKTAQP